MKGGPRKRWADLSAVERQELLERTKLWPSPKLDGPKLDLSEQPADIQEAVYRHRARMAGEYGPDAKEESGK